MLNNLKNSISSKRTKCASVITLFIVIAFVLAGCASFPPYGTSTKGLELPIEKATLKFMEDVKAGGYKIVNTSELKKWYAEGKKMIVISTFPPADDKALGTLPSAVSGPMPMTEKEVTQAVKDGIIKTAGKDKDMTIVVYCGFVACRRSHLGAKTLAESGYKNVYRYPGGIAGWKEASAPAK
ncbi:MAG: rhodanese-like domain-containing protein [Spirochaetota bacterium]